MKSELSALLMPVLSASQAGQPLLNEELGQDSPAMRNEAGCLKDASRTFKDAGTFKDSYPGRAVGVKSSNSFNRRVDHAACAVITKKKRFG